MYHEVTNSFATQHSCCAVFFIQACAVLQVGISSFIIKMVELHKNIDHKMPLIQICS